MDKRNNIILTGFMGTGKTTVGQILAKRLQYQFVDSDELIEQREGRSIAEIFREDGQNYFRHLESEISKELGKRQDLVIATGGRLMLDQENASVLGNSGQVFCLSASPAVLWKRLEHDGGKRPLINDSDPQQKIQELLSQRAQAYGRFPQIDTSDRSPEQIASEIQLLLGKEILPVSHPSGHYHVIIGHKILPQIDKLGHIDGPIAIVTDSHVGPLHAHRIGPVKCEITIPAGEQHKNLATVESIYNQLLAAGLDRQGTIIALGGGVVGDVAGFVAATYLRGIAVVQCPTSLLAMVDASVGGKTGVDLPQGKNLVGAFKQPQAVLVDLQTLSTLPKVEFSAGMAEVIKAGIIADDYLFNLLENSREWQSGDQTELQSMVSRAIGVKRQIVQEDPFEKGRRAVLNLGHTFAHAIEQVSGYSVRHGEAVAMGLVAASHLSAAEGYCSKDLQSRIEGVLMKSELPVRIPNYLAAADLFKAMSTDKKKAKGTLRFILIRDVGDVFISGDISENAILNTLRACQENIL